MAHTEAVTASTLSVIPPERLGALLRATRQQRAVTLADVAERSPFSPGELAGVEAGERSLTEAEVGEVLRAYGIDESTLVPQRGELVVDLSDHRLAAGGQVRTLAGEAPTADEVLATYLSLVYTLRHAAPGTPLVLREADLAVLSRALELARPEVERRLHDLMVDADGAVRERVRGLRSRLLLPAIGVALAATAAGGLLVVRAVASDPPSDPTVEVGPAAEPVPLSQEPPVVVIGEGIPVDQLPPGAVNLGVPQVAERDPDGSVRQGPRQPATAASPEPTAPESTTTTWLVQEGPVGDLKPGEVRLGEAQTIENTDQQP